MATATNVITRYRLLETPAGEFRVELHADGTITTSWTDLVDEEPPKEWIKGDLLLPDLVEDLNKYFNGDLEVDFSYVATPKGSDFYRKCWDAARKIPPGEVWTYGQLAKKAGSASAARAAGQAMRNNPVPVIIPCHRVCGSDGSLVGYGGQTGKKETAGIRIKKKLLDLEGYKG